MVRAVFIEHILLSMSIIFPRWASNPRYWYLLKTATHLRNEALSLDVTKVRKLYVTAAGLRYVHLWHTSEVVVCLEIVFKNVVPVRP